MPNRLLHKRSSVPGAVPAAASLTPGELALNTADGRLFTEKADGTVVEFARADQFVKSVNGVGPDGTGNVEVAVGGTTNKASRFFFGQI